MDFPHINDTNFPHLNTVDVYKFQNDFDYARWNGKVSIKLLNVLWNSNYADVPGFEDDAKRDEWFDAQTGMVQTLESGFNITPDNSVKIPIPYNDAYRYNYLMVDMPMQTSAEMPIDYENEQTRVKRWYYFIDSMTQYAPNTTELFITLDVWTTFSHTVEIPYLMLERGHAPMMQTNVEDYLSNPIENNEYLLAEDFNYGNINRNVATSTYFPIGNGEKYVLFAVPLTQADFANLGGASLSGNSTPPTFSDTSERWGYQIVVNDYEWKYGNVSYANAKLPITSFLNEDSVFNGNYVYAIKSTQAQNFFNDVAHNCVHLLHAIQGIFVVSKDMLSFASSFTFRGVTLYNVNKQYQVYDLALKKEAFNFEDKYSEITKLYTFPYSVIEITDDNGFSSEVRVENTGKLQMHKELSIAFPYVRYQTFFTGMNGNGKLDYVWRNLNDSNVNKEMWEDDFSKFMMNWDIPTFGIFASAEAEYAASHYFGNMARRQGAIIGYENAVRYANTNCENVDDQTDAMQTNTATQNAANSEIVIRSGVTSIENQYTANSATANNADYNIAKLQADVQADNGLSAALTIVQNDVISTTTALNNACSIDVAGFGAIGNTLSNPISMGSGLGSIIGSVIQANNATATSGVVIGSNWASMINVVITNNAKAANAVSNIQAVTMENTTAFNRIVNRTQTTSVDNTTTQNDANTSITNTNAAMMDNNADWTRKAHVVAEQHNLEQVQREVEAQYLNNRLGNPVLETDYSGDAYPDVFERRGIRMNIRTQTKSAIAQTGDAMLRYGYALHRVWNMANGFHYGKHFTFWKAEDIWINEGSGIAGNAVNIIGDILLKGVTIWRNPDEIGKVSIYDNI